MKISATRELSPGVSQGGALWFELRSKAETAVFRTHSLDWIMDGQTEECQECIWLALDQVEL